MSGNKLKLTLFQMSAITIFRILDKISSPHAGLFLYNLWLMPGIKIRKHNRVLPIDTRQFWLKVGSTRVAYWESGTGPTVLFVHGWGSYGAQFSKMIKILNSAGYRAVWFDAPAHGESSGWQTNIFEINECITSLQDKYGHFDLVIGHSFGALSLMKAISEGLSTSKFVAISSPTSALSLVDKFCSLFNPSAQSKVEMKEYIEKKFGNDLWDKITVMHMAKNIKQPVLLIHDKNDPVVTCKEGIANKRKLLDVEFILTERLGHFRIIHDSGVSNAILAFIKDTENVEYSAASII